MWRRCTFNFGRLYAILTSNLPALMVLNPLAAQTVMAGMVWVSTVGLGRWVFPADD